jgi:threonine/homoserine/homoserine lactone efflux protein
VDTLLPLLLGFVIAFVGSIPIAGPLAVLVVRRATQREYKSALFIAFGGATAEAMFALVIGIVFPLLGSLIDGVVQVARALGAVVLLGVGVLLALRPKTGEGFVPKRRRASFLMGLAAAGMNPTIIATWLLVVTSLYGMGLLHVRYTTAPLFAIGVALGTSSWFALLLVIGERFEHVITDRRREILMRALGVGLIGASVYLAVKLFSEAPESSSRASYVPSSAARAVALSTASIKARRSPPRSSACSPLIAVPPGLVTMSLSRAGCSPVSS